MNEPHTNKSQGLQDTASLIVSADDYGYFRSVSAGILECADHGVVTATAIMANSPHFDTCVEWLADRPGLDIGVHLTLSFGVPLTSVLRNSLTSDSGNFPARFGTAIQLMTGRLRRQVVLDECRAQIERCLQAGLTLRFLNSHEHIHMLPVLWGGIQRLADEYNIAYTRVAGPEWRSGRTPASLFRNILLQSMGWTNSSNGRRPIRCLGTGVSGQLNVDYLADAFSRLKPGRVYELMCHPGRFDKVEITNQELCSFHNWEGEMQCLLGAPFRRLCEQYRVECVRYRDLARPEESAMKQGVMA